MSRAAKFIGALRAMSCRAWPRALRWASTTPCQWPRLRSAARSWLLSWLCRASSSCGLRAALAVFAASCCRALSRAEAWLLPQAWLSCCCCRCWLLSSMPNQSRPASAASRPGRMALAACCWGLGAELVAWWPGLAEAASLAVRLKSFMRRLLDGSSCNHWGQSVAAGVAEAACATLTFVELLDQLEMRLDHRHQNQLGDTLADGNGEGALPAVPAGHHQLALVVRVDQADQVAEDDAMFMAQARTRQDHRRQTRVADID